MKANINIPFGRIEKEVPVRKRGLYYVRQTKGMNTNLFFISTSYDFVKKKRIRFGDLLVVFLQLQLTWPRPESIPSFLRVNVLIGLYDQIVLLNVYVVFA